VALQSDDIDFRSRPHSAEERDFLVSSVAGRYLETTYDALDSAPAVVLVGLEPEEESPIVFLRLRKAVQHHALPVFGVAPFRSNGLRKLNGRLIAALPGGEAEVLTAIASASAGDESDAGAARAALDKS